MIFFVIIGVGRSYVLGLFGPCEYCSGLLCPNCRLRHGVLDFTSLVSASNVHSAGSSLAFWTFQVLFLLLTSNPSTLARRFGLFMLIFCSLRPFCLLWLHSLDFSSLISACNVQFSSHMMLFWTFGKSFSLTTSKPPATSTHISYGCQKSHLTPATFYILCIFFDILSDCLNAVEVFLTNTCHLNTEFIINISDDFK